MTYSCQDLFRGHLVNVSIWGKGYWIDRTLSRVRVLTFPSYCIEGNR